MWPGGSGESDVVGAEDYADGGLRNVVVQLRGIRSYLEAK